MRITQSIIYNFGMAKFIYVQINGVEKPAQIRADKAEKAGAAIGKDPDTLILKIGDKQVGEFKMSAVQGWWIEGNDSEAY